MQWYKVYSNRQLKILENSGLGLHMGSHFCGIPTCADDNLTLIMRYKPWLMSVIHITLTISLLYIHKKVPSPSKLGKEIRTMSGGWEMPHSAKVRPLPTLAFSGKSAPDTAKHIQTA